jgi:hypothetical protein
MNAQVGSWIAFKLGSKLAPVITTVISGGMEAKDAALMVLTGDILNLSKSEFFDLQNEALAVVAKLEMVGNVEAPMPLKMADGKIIVDLNPLTLITLTVQSLLFNLLPFFDVDALKDAAKSFPDLPDFDV